MHKINPVRNIVSRNGISDISNGVNRVYLYAVVTVLALIKISILYNFRIWDVTPDIQLVAVIFFGLHLGREKGFEMGLFAGFLNDALSAAPFGLGILGYALIGFFSGMASKKFYKENFLTQSFFSFLGAVIFSLICLMPKLRASDYPGPAPAFATRALVHAVYTACIAPFIFLILFRLFKIKET